MGDCIFTVQGNEPLTAKVFELTFEAQGDFSFRAGQFISIAIPQLDTSHRVRRAYSIASPPEKRPIELCIDRLGSGLTYLSTLKKGDTFKGSGPHGTFLYDYKPGMNAYFIATGSGIAPFRSLFLSQDFRSHPPATAVCLLGVRTESELLYEKDLRSLLTVEWIPCVSQPGHDWRGCRGRVTDYLRTLGMVFPWRNTEFYLCGSGAMIREAAQLLRANEVPLQSIHREVFYYPTTEENL